MKLPIRKLLSLCLLFSMTAALLTGCSGGKKQVNVLTYEGYIPDEIIADYEARGYQVNYTAAQTNEQMLDLLQAAKGGTYDIVICDDYIIPSMIESQVAAQLDYGRLSHAENIDPHYQSQFYDEENLYSIPYLAGFPLIVYDPAQVDFEIKGYADLWDSRLKNKLVILDQYRVIPGITLLSMGQSMNTTDQAVLAQCREKLLQLKPNVKLIDGSTPHVALINGDAAAGFVFTSQAMEVVKQRPDFEVVYPEEGLGFGVSCLMIAANAPHMDAAYDFVNYLLDGEVSAKVSELINYINCNTAAEAYLSAEFKANPVVYPPDSAFPPAAKRAPEIIQTVDNETNQIYDEMWTAFKNQ